MRNRRQPSRGKKINPHFWVFCEGETEEAYVCYLRSKYRMPIEIIPKVSGHNISERYIKSCKKGKPTHEKDKDFLIYDGDIDEIVQKLKKIPATKLIVSKPAIEFWFLLHYKNQKAEVTTDKCIRELSNRNRVSYKKGFLDSTLKSKLGEKLEKACERAKTLTLFKNPSSNMYIFIEELEKARKEKR